MPRYLGIERWLQGKERPIALSILIFAPILAFLILCALCIGWLMPELLAKEKTTCTSVESNYFKSLCSRVRCSGRKVRICVTIYYPCYKVHVRANYHTKQGQFLQNILVYSTFDQSESKAAEIASEYAPPTQFTCYYDRRRRQPDQSGITLLSASSGPFLGTIIIGSITLIFLVLGIVFAIALLLQRRRRREDAVHTWVSPFPSTDGGDNPKADPIPASPPACSAASPPEPYGTDLKDLGPDPGQAPSDEEDISPFRPQQEYLTSALPLECSACASTSTSPLGEAPPVVPRLSEPSLYLEATREEVTTWEMPLMALSAGTPGPDLRSAGTGTPEPDLTSTGQCLLEVVHM
eukprot:gnl/Trimastix_PCT/3983.p1 GENE.gnl/Trimastix_PCT/3983~~gnl/Trimastix_PCT/3983.p1  ORF type:complete len:350 (+),score=13.06 gnl/Trimastix_PCT/3983:52-1101(+)